MKAPFILLFICYANGFEESGVFPTEDEIMIHHFTNNPRRSGERGAMEPTNNQENNLEIKKSGKLITQKLLSWLATTTTSPPKNTHYTVFPTVIMDDPMSANPYFPAGHYIPRRSDRRMLSDPLLQRGTEMRRRFRRASRKIKSSDEIDDSYEPAKIKDYLRSRGQKSNEIKSHKKQGAFYHGSDLEKFDDIDDDEPVKNDRDDRHFSEKNNKNNGNEKRSSETYKNYDHHDKQSSEKNNYHDDKYDKMSKRERDLKKDRKKYDEHKTKKGSFKPGGSIEYETEEKLEKRYKKDSGENGKKYSKGKKTRFLSDKKRSEETPREKNEKAHYSEPNQEKSRDRDLKPVSEKSKDRDVETGRDQNEDADLPTRSIDDKMSGEEKRSKKHKTSHKKHHKKRTTRKSEDKISKRSKSGRKSYKTKRPLHNSNSEMGWTKLVDDASYENFRRHYYSNPRRQKREIYGFESGKPYKIGETRRLIAATTARIEDFPYMASIQKYGEHWCSGAILNQRVIITTANCVWRSVDLSRMKVRVGSRHAMDGGQISDIQEVAKHPGWSLRQRNPDFDLALLLTTRPFKFCDTVHSIDLPNKNMFPAFDDSFIASFGAERRDGVMDELHPTLQSYRAEIIPLDECNKMTKRFNVSVSNNFICFAQRGRRAPCTRDTGAPAVSDGVVWGLASWSIRKKCGTERFPAVFSYTGSIDNIHFLINATLKLMSEKRLPTYYDKLGTLDPQGKRHPMG